jgi:type II secretory pathway pseudopilin PulG
MKTRGFTLIEVSIIILIMLIVVTIIIGVFSTLNSSQGLLGSAEEVRSIIQKAQSLTLSSKGDTRYGVHFDTNQVVLYQGSSYSSSDANNVVTPLSSKVTISSIVLVGGGSEVLFDRLTGATSQSGTTTIALVSDATKTVKIIIAPTGSISTQ